MPTVVQSNYKTRNFWGKKITSTGYNLTIRGTKILYNTHDLLKVNSVISNTVETLVICFLG